MKLIRELIGMYRPRYANTLVYMLQNVEYQTKPYRQWLWRTKDFSTVMYRRQLDKTKAARLLLLAVSLGISLQVGAGVALIVLGLTHYVVGGVAFGTAVIVAYPIVWGYAVVLPLVVGRLFISQPAEQRLIAESEKIFAKHRGIKIAVAGSYGKTSMKELLNTVLSEGLSVAATPANKNVSISHAYFARKLTGQEDVLIIEYGEGAPGDIARFARITQPTHAVITGLAPAHLDHYKTLAAAGKDIFTVADYVKPEHVYVNSDSADTKPFLKRSYELFSNDGALGWEVKKVVTEISGTSFELHKGKKVLKLQSGLVGRHQLGFLTFVAALALEFGLSETQVRAGIAKTQPFEHRMQPYQLSGAWVVDDTYNGNLEGIRAGTQLLQDLSAKRKIYVTPGLVDQGVETERIHLEVGKLIAAAQPDIVILMQNSATPYIQQGLETAVYSGEVRVEKDPLDFYTNLTHFVAAGDLVVMQNDWTDNYA